MKPMNKYIFIALAFFTLAALLRFWVAPVSERLPASYSNSVTLSEENTFRDSPTGTWQASTLNTTRVDQTITNSGQMAIIEGSLHVYYVSGAVNFEVTSLYGVDRRTRLNLPGYGSFNRTGQYLFPPHVRTAEYPIWDPFFIGLRQAVFDHSENMDGLQIYVFRFSGTNMDETAGYSYLSDIPEHYLAHTDGQGRIWVEPLSGIVVDYMDDGVSYFVDPSSGAHIADFNQWTEKYTAETKTTQFALAHNARLRILVLEDWLPGGLVLIGLLLPGLFIIVKMKTRKLNKAA